jgi:anaerobic magnesium-protoporphyrin IX monomethyl ester cyclase
MALDILLIALPVFKLPGVCRSELVDFYGKGKEFPTGLMSIASYLSEQGFSARVVALDVYIFDTITSDLESLQLIYGWIQHLGPRMLGFSISYKIQEAFAIRLINSLRERYPQLPIVVGGSHVTASPLTFNHLGVELVIGEGEKAVSQILKGTVDIKSLHQRPASKKLNLWPLTERMKEKDLPTIQYRLFNMPGGVHINEFSHFLPTSRGCVGRCSFCTSPTIWAGGIRRKPIERLRNELIELVQEGVAVIDLVDDIINSDNFYFNRLCHLCQEFSSIQFPVMSRLDLLNDENLKAMAISGMNSLYVGVENTQEVVLKKMNKRLSPLKFEELLKRSRDYGIRVGTFWMFGHPGSTREVDTYSIEDLFRWLYREVIDEASLGIFLPVPGALSSIDPSVQLLDVEPEAWTGMKPVHRLINPDGSPLYQEDEMVTVLEHGMAVLSEFGLNNNTISV